MLVFGMLVADWRDGKGLGGLGRMLFVWVGVSRFLCRFLGSIGRAFIFPHVYLGLAEGLGIHITACQFD